MNTKDKVLDILEETTGSAEVRNNLDLNIFDEGLLDSMGSIQLILELQNELGVDIPISEFERSEWATPNLIIAKVESLI
ncbi:D-alanine--poly(phosphoribitol) ligase subunit DltC [Dellaglioa sp. P0083]|uniref:D-alanine--poly(phosphoribitol) ligase subunit DltC n=1 Tax=Dellaglioa kimchii TaxID=3344667 RepID=UPI0038D3C6B8